jgi:long-chain acyl-CoA synthetase
MIISRLWFDAYDQGVPKHIEYPRISLIDMLENSAQKYPDHIVTFDNEKPIYYREFITMCNCLALNLIHMGIKEGDPIALSLPNSWRFILAFFAILKAGAIVVGINPLIRTNEMNFLLKKSQARWLFIDMDPVRITGLNFENSTLKGITFTKPFENAVEGADVRKIRLSQFNELLINNNSLEIRYPSLSAETPAIYQFTGGTTGFPKAAIGSHFNLVANIIQFRNWLTDLKEGEETMLAAIPLTHVYGLVLAMCLGIYLGARIICISNPREVDLLVQAIDKYQVTVFPAVPNLIYGMVEWITNRKFSCNLDSLKVCISGSSPLHPYVQGTFSSLIRGKLVEGYGLSEAPTATHCNPVQGIHKPGSIGLPLPDVDCRIVDMKRGTKDVAPGEIGELLIKGPQVMQGYFNNRKETKKTLKDDWLHTGDIVRMDEHGYFFLIDRKKDVVKVSGFQVWPKEVEEVIFAHTQVSEAAVAGVRDIKRGERVVAWVVLKAQATLTAEELKTWCREKLSAYKVPSEIIFVQSLPRTFVGKVLRRVLIKSKIGTVP